jgi:hypothetical protein
MPTTTTEPLTRGHQMFLQRMLASHVMSDDDAKQLHEELNDHTRSKTLEQSLSIMNTQLIHGFGLEVATVNLDGKRYHAIVNPHGDNDNIAKASFANLFTPHEKAFIRACLELLVEHDNDNNKCPRADLINLRMKLQEPFKSISMDAAEHVLDTLLEEQWLVTEATQNRRKSVSAVYELGPRTYLELSSLLVEFGMSKEDLPQFIFHSILS